MKNMFGFKTINEIDKTEYEGFLSEIERSDLIIRHSICDSTMIIINNSDNFYIKSEVEF